MEDVVIKTKGLGSRDELGIKAGRVLGLWEMTRFGRVGGYYLFFYLFLFVSDLFNGMVWALALTQAGQDWQRMGKNRPSRTQAGQNSSRTGLAENGKE